MLFRSSLFVTTSVGYSIKRKSEVERTSLIGDHTRVIEEQVTESVAVGIDCRFTAEARRVEDGKRLQSSQSRLTFGHCCC